MTKWFFALSAASLNQTGQDWTDLVRTAVVSAKANTGLKPHFLYDGVPNEFTAELVGLGVSVIYHQVSYLSNIVERWNDIGLPPNDNYMAIIAGAYLRTEIPRLPLDDDFVLYTDCDVFFKADPEIERFRPQFFACAPQFDPDDTSEINSGVMVMNIKEMRKETANFYHYIVNRFEQFSAHDQDALQQYYAERYEFLPSEMNWKPYWGTNPEARIVHFHGPKPWAVRRLITEPSFPVPDVWRTLYESHPAAYFEYLNEWENIRKNDIEAKLINL